MNPRLWQRQPGETPADFTAFAAYLRLKGRRSHRLVADQTGRSRASIGRLSARFNWPGRIVAFEARLAEATQDALDAVLRLQPKTAKCDFERLRQSQSYLATRVIHESRRWLDLASNPRRPLCSLSQLCRLIEMAFKLARLATGMPDPDAPRRRRKEDAPGYWTGPTAEEALKKIYGKECFQTPARHADPVPVSGPPCPPGRVSLNKWLRAEPGAHS